MNIRKPILFLFLLFSVGYLMAQPIISKTVTQTTCNNNDGAVTLNVSGGLPPYSYEWRQGDMNGPIFSNNTTVSNLSVGYYSLKVTDANNDFATDSISIENGITAYAYTTVNAVCPLSNGSVQAVVQGGMAPYTYSWSNGAKTDIVSGLAGGSTLKIEIKDANGCNAYFNNYNVYPVVISSVYEVTVGVTSTINSTYASTPEQCPLNNGTITLYPTGGTGPYTYYWNTTPVENTQTITGLSYGAYSATITDAIGCKYLAYTYVGNNAGALNATAVKTNDLCSKSIGTASITITGGVPPYTVNWPDASSALSRSDLGYGFHNVSVTDQNNCVFILRIFIDDLSPVTSWIATTETDCDNISGTAGVTAIGGVGPYTYNWNNGASSAAISALSLGYYSVLVKDVNGCKAFNWTRVNIKNSCYGNISGKIFQDNNGNCLQDPEDYSIMNNWTFMDAAASSHSLFDSYSYTGFTGNYSMRYVLPDQYTVNYYDYDRTAACPLTGNYGLSIPASGVDYPNKDFAMVPKSLFEDASILQYYGCMFSEPRPGFEYSYYFAYKNIGTLPSDGFIEVVYGDFESFVTSTPAADFYDPATKTLRFNYSTLMLGELRGVNLTFKIPAITLLGTTYSHSITADIGGIDPTPENNLRNINFTVVGSFDPNDLRVTPAGMITEEDSILSYSIRFQNTGTYPAEFVIIKDTLEANLDISSISDIVASHNYKFRILENRAIEFAFEDINLPDSNRNEPSSHGFVNFRIRKNKNLVPGTQIKNRAEIYFDYNAPVVTNSTINTMALVAGINEKTTSTGKLYPNPAKDFAAFSFEKEISSVQLMNGSGITVLSQTVNNEKDFRINLSLSKGMYFYKAISSDGNSFSGKLLIE